MEENKKTPEELAAERLCKANALRNAIGQLQMKLRFIDNSTTIEDQIKSLCKYNDIPSKDELVNSDKKLDSYREDFLNSQYDSFFLKYPEMLEKLGDKKTDNNVLNFHALGLLSFLFSSYDEETLKKNHKDSVNEYFTYLLPEYQNFLIKYIVDNKQWHLTKNTEAAFSKYAEIHQEHNELLKSHENIMISINTLIRDVVNQLVDKISEAKQLGLDEETYSQLVSDKIIGKYRVLRMVLNQMASGGASVLQVFIGATFKDFTLSDIYKSIAVVEGKLVLDEKQQEELKETRKMIETLQEKGFAGSSGSGSGCMVIIGAIIVFSASLAGIVSTLV